SERPDVIGQPCRHRGRTGPPHLGGAMALGWHGLSESLAQTGVRQHEIVIGLEQHQLLAQPVFALTWCRTAPPHRRDPLTQAQIEPLYKGRIDVPAAS